MRSMQIIEWGKPLQMRELPTPIPKGTELLVQVESCGVCHSDLHIWEGFFDLGNGQKFAISERGVHPPFTMGHEPVGKVIAQGPDAIGADIGKSYAVYPWIECGHCRPCTTGLPQICDAPKIIGTRVAGAYSDHVIVPNAKYLVDYSGINPDLAATLACSGLTTYSALNKLDLAKMTNQDTLLIIGAGGLGLSAICIARALCNARIVVVDIDSDKRAAARTIGADIVIYSAASDAGAQLSGFADAQDGRGIAASVDFVGLPQTMAFALAALRKGGQHVHVGLFGGAHPISLPPLAFRMLRVMGSYVGTLEEFRALVKLVQGGLALPIPISTRPLDQAAQALADLQSGKILGRVVLRP